MVIKLKTEIQEKLIKNKTHQFAEPLDDLQVTDEQARQTKGGSDDRLTAKQLSQGGAKSSRLFFWKSFPDSSMVNSSSLISRS